MNFKIEIATEAVIEIKRLTKKYRSFKNDFGDLVTLLEQDPVQGEPLGKDCYKVRFAITTNQKGKSGGARVITCVKIVDERVLVLSVYDKSESDSIRTKEIERRLKNAGLL
jgi:mRNA-degrading endonuclease RelE of RelBE toxin-antitoxin system